MAGEHPRCGLFLPGFPEAVESSKGSPGGQFHGRVDGFGNGGPRHVAHQVSCSRGAGGDQRARGPTRRHLPHAARGSHPQPFRRSETGRAAARRAGDARVARHRAEESPYHGAPRLGAAAARSISAEVAAPHRRAGEDHLGSGGPDSAGRFHERVFSFDAKGGNPRHRRLRPSAAAREARRLLRNRMQIILFHLMPYADLDLEAGRKNGTVWVRLPNRHFDPEKGHRLYNRYLDELEHAERLGFDAVSVNEHHQTAYGLMPSPIVTASALARRYTYLQTFSPARVVQRYLKLYRDTCSGYGYEAQDSQLGWAVPVYVANTDEEARREAKPHFEAFRNVFVKMPLEMLLPPGYTSRESLKNVMKAKAQMFGDVTIDQAVELGLFVCGSAETVRKAFEGYWNDMRFGNLLVLCQFGTLPAELTRKNMEFFAREVMPRLKPL